jgi:hypothetical protein
MAVALIDDILKGGDLVTGIAMGAATVLCGRSFAHSCALWLRPPSEAAFRRIAR